ncbi:hypothetical protein C0583_04975 [Candidatus Parcubacteria bacterium]|nr:MAG: hypothetical protein C0583_04975 [Candidatus Parcubacteria bacterium]
MIKNLFLKTEKRGFTLVELLIVIGVIAVLASLAFVALDPLARFQDSRNAQRWTDVNAVLSAVKLDQVDNGGLYMDAINDLTNDYYYMIGTEGDCNKTCSNPTVVLQADCVDLEGLLDDGYLQEIPFDPSQTGAGSNYSYYYLVKHTSGAITVGSCSEEAGSQTTPPSISSTR